MNKGYWVVRVNTDKNDAVKEYADIAKFYGAKVPFLRPESISGDKSPDIEWVKLMLNTLKKNGDIYDAYSILRPTSPFRLASTIERAWNLFLNSRSSQ